MTIRRSRAVSLASAATLALQLILLTARIAASASLPETLIYSFGFGPSSSVCRSAVDGAIPKSSLTLANGMLFGRTTITTASTPGDGIIFHIAPDGSGYSIDHVFKGATADGNSSRYNAMTLDGTVLYGTTTIGGKRDNGTIFSINDDGTGYSGPLLNFQATNINNSGDQPQSCFALASSSGLLYGMTSQGGNQGGLTGNGVLFSFDPQTSTYTKLLSLNGPKRGIDPHGQPILDPNGTTLYGMTRQGGKHNVGAIFSFDTASNKVKTLHNFNCAKSGKPACMEKKDGATTDHGTLVQLGSTLYGMTTFGGRFGAGIVFSISTAGRPFKVLHNFGNTSADGQHPYGSLLLAGGTLYGTTREGGSKGLGTVFQINPDGTNYARIYNFTGTPDGANPVDNVIFSNGSLFGMTTVGGKCGFGAIFAVQLP